MGRARGEVDHQPAARLEVHPPEGRSHHEHQQGSPPIHAGFNEDFSNYGGWVGAESARKWHAVGGKVATYASPHTGPENPDYMRRLGAAARERVRENFLGVDHLLKYAEVIRRIDES